MSGHSKWSQIKRKKGIKDVQKGQIFTKMSKLITLAVKEGGGITDSDKNVKLRLAIDRARAENMPKDTIERAIEKAKGGGEANLKEVIYEGFGPGGVAFLVSCLTDNPNRTHSEVKNTFEKNAGKIGAAHSVSYLFQKCGLVLFEKSENNEDNIMEFADKMDEIDVTEDDKTYTVYVPFEKTGHVGEFLGELKASKIDIDYRPLSAVKIIQADEAKKILRLVMVLEDLEDVHKVYSNFDIPEEFME